MSRSPSQDLLAGFVKTTLVHRHAFIPSLSQTRDLGREAQVPGSLELPGCPAADAAIAAGRWSQARRLADGPLAGVLALYGARAPRGATFFEGLIERSAARSGAKALERWPFWQGLALLRRCELDAAASKLERAGGPWGFLALSECQRVDIDYRESLRACEKAFRLDPRNAWVEAFRSRALFQSGRRAFAEGLRAMDRAVELSPRSGWIRAWRADGRRKMGDLQGALSDLRAARELEPSYDRTYLWLGKTLLALGRLPEALKALDEGLTRCPYFEKAHAERSRVLRGLGRMEEALAELDSAAAVNHRHNWLGNWTAIVAPLSDSQARDLELLAAFAARSGKGLGWLGESLVQAGRFEEGLAVLRKARRSAWTRAWEGEALVRLGRLEEARPALDAAVKEDPSYGRAFAWRGRLRQLLGRRAEAAADYDRAVGDSLIEYSWLYYWRGQVRGDARDLRTALFLEPERAEFKKACRGLR